MQHEPSDWPARVVRSRGYKVYALVFLLDLLWNGFSRVDSFSPAALKPLLSTARQPFAFQGETVFYQEAPLFFLLAHGAGATTTRGYFLFCVAAAVAAHVAFLVAAVRALGKEGGITAGLLFLAHPIGYILKTWLGMVDPITVGCTAVLLFARRPPAVLAAAAVSMVNHPATTFIVPALLALRFVGDPADATVRTLAAGGVGMAVGKALCRLIRSFYPFEIFTRWYYFLAVPPGRWLEINFAHLSLCVYSFGFALWVPLAVGLIARYREKRRLVEAYGMAMAVLYGVAFFTLDTTRVFAVLAWAPTLSMLIGFLREPPGAGADTHGPRTFPDLDLGALVRWTALLGWLAPHLFVWDGGVYAPGLWEMVQVVRTLAAP